MRRLLEIGAGGVTSKGGYQSALGGASLRMWQDYFLRARIVGLDLEAKAVTGRRIRVERGSQDDRPFLLGLAARHGPFDVVIDDGSRIGRHQWASFEALFDSVVPGGMYIIEDLATAYVPAYEGGPVGEPGTSVQLVKDVVDSVLRRHAGRRGHPVAELHVYDEIAFIVRS